MNIDFKAGRSTVTIVGGWLVDLETSRRRYTTQESDPIYETKTHTTYFEQDYIDSDGDVRTRRWSHSEDRTEQVGSDYYSVDREVTDATYRIAYDDGTKTSQASHPRHSGYGDRVHWYSITHPLLRKPVSGRLYSMTATPGHMTWWQRLVTLPARREIGRRIAKDRSDLLKAVSHHVDAGEDRSAHHVLVDGTWDAARRRLRTPRGDHSLPRAGRIADGATVGVLLRERGYVIPFVNGGRTLVVDGWSTVEGRNWASRRKPLTERMWKTRLPIAIGIAAIVMALLAVPLRSDPLLIGAGIAALVAFLGFRGASESRETWLDRFHGDNVAHSMRMLRQKHWIAAMRKARNL